MNKALKEYQEKVKAGLVERTPNKTVEEKLAQKPTSLRLVIDVKCKDCIYDDKSKGNWKAQVGQCVDQSCSLWLVRPRSSGGKNGEGL